MAITEFARADGRKISLSAGMTPAMPAPTGDQVADWRADIETRRHDLAAAEQPSIDLESENDRLRKAAKLQAERVASVAHELRTPLCSVLGFTKLLLTRDHEPSMRRRCLEIIDSEIRRLDHLIEGLLEAELQHDEDGESTLSLELFDLGALLSEQVDLFRMQSEAHELHLALPTTSLLVRADREQIAQVIGNLLSNAIKYSPEGGAVFVTAESYDGTVRVSLRDNGLGIPTEQQHLVFGRFFRADTSQTNGIKGTGLGLALSRAIVDSHAGSIGFNSTRGQGSTFWFELRSARR